MADHGVDEEHLAMLKKAFGMFDQKKTGSIEVNKVAAILNTMGQQFDDDELQQLCTEKAKDGKLDFDSFVSIASNFLEEEDDEAMQAELKEAFRLYDKEGNGYITTQVLKEILKALDDKLTSEDLDGIIEEVDTDGSGTLDFDEFMEMMAGE
ncbi:troponin C, isoallergen Bla g 6.0101-like isoform X2 [Amphibalanus amphitrite]|uniref:troponin C, isoallergen Bla g 6.0101-like isoform X2 n=1 Tax=Amphibalanus amphitrite TaxID=1232801 RepID=UPI001C90D355|nr:troponin C, isoallergen Bla g 6.0101-like isoform X2 [Amphibalanus amphitrite]